MIMLKNWAKVKGNTVGNLKTRNGQQPYQKRTVVKKQYAQSFDKP